MDCELLSDWEDSNLKHLSDMGNSGFRSKVWVKGDVKGLSIDGGDLGVKSFSVIGDCDLERCCGFGDPLSEISEDTDGGDFSLNKELVL